MRASQPGFQAMDIIIRERKHGVKTPYHRYWLELIIAAMSYQSVNPSNGKVLKKFKELSDAQLEIAIKTAATCFETSAQSFCRAGNHRHESRHDHARTSG